MTFTWARSYAVRAPPPLVKLSLFSVTVPSAMIRVVNDGVSVAVLRSRV
ncbi:MAG: hypothetical protein ACRDPY_20490 [Streptosporangiaceae bacterium]